MQNVSTENQDQKQDWDAAAQISEAVANLRISKDMEPTIRALEPYQQKAILTFLEKNRHADIYSARELMDAWLNINGIYGFVSGILDIAHAIYNPMPPAQNDPNRPIYDLELSTRTQNALIQNDIQSLGQLAAADYRTLFCIPFIGRLAIREINEVLIANGYKAKV